MRSGEAKDIGQMPGINTDFEGVVWFHRIDFIKQKWATEGLRHAADVVEPKINLTKEKKKELEKARGQAEANIAAAITEHSKAHDDYDALSANYEMDGLADTNPFIVETAKVYQVPVDQYLDDAQAQLIEARNAAWQQVLDTNATMERMWPNLGEEHVKF